MKYEYFAGVLKTQKGAEGNSVAIVKATENESCYFEFNDSTVRQIKSLDFLQSSPTLIFYQKNSSVLPKKPATPIVPNQLNFSQRIEISKQEVQSGQKDIDLLTIPLSESIEVSRGRNFKRGIFF